MPATRSLSLSGHRFSGDSRCQPSRSSHPSLGWIPHFSETARRNPGIRGFDFMIGLFADITSEAVTGTLLPALEQTRPDLVIYEALDAGAGIAANVLGVPSVAFAIELAHQGFAMIHPAAIRYWQDLWTTRGLQPPDHDPSSAGV